MANLPCISRCTMGGQRFEASTGFFLDKSSWLESAQLADGKTEDIKVINNRITKIRTKVRDIFVFAYDTGLSYVDISKLNSGNIQKFKRIG